MIKILIAVVFLTFSNVNAQTLIKKENNEVGFDLKKEDPIFVSNYGYCKLYKLNNDVFIMWNGYSDVSKTKTINRNVLEEIIRASKMIQNSEKGDMVQLESIDMIITHRKNFGTFYDFEYFINVSEPDLSDLTFSEIEQLAYTSNVNSVESDGEKVMDKVKNISSEIKEQWLALTKNQLQELIDLKY